MITQENLEAIKQLKAEFRQKWPVSVEREIWLLQKRLYELKEVESILDKTTLECEIAKLARTAPGGRRLANMVDGPLLGDGCKMARPFGGRKKVVGRTCPVS